MFYSIITTTNARLDIQEAIDWENKRSPGLANVFFAKKLSKNEYSETPVLHEVTDVETQYFASPICCSRHVFRQIPPRVGVYRRRKVLRLYILRRAFLDNFEKTTPKLP